MGMSWCMLLLAGLFEILWVLGLKFSEGFTVLIPSVLTVSAMVISFLLLAVAIKKIPVGTAYACWTGIGAAGGAFLGMYFFCEPSEWARILCIIAIISGVVGLKIYSGSHKNA